MREIDFIVWVGEFCCAARLSKVMGSGSDTHFHLYFRMPDGWRFQGSLFKRGIDWAGLEKYKIDTTEYPFLAEDVRILVDMVETNFFRCTRA